MLDTQQHRDCTDKISSMGNHTKPVAVYRMYDADARLLYVGQSKAPMSRAAQLAANAEWATQVATVTLAWCKDRVEAVEVEARAIRDEAPIYNVQHGTRHKTARDIYANSGGCKHPDLLTEINGYCRVTGISRGAFGVSAMKDPRFVYDLEAGRQCLPRTVAKVRSFLAGAA